MIFFNFKNTIRYKLSLTVGIVTTGIFVIFIILISIRTRQVAIDTAEKIAITESSECAEHIQVELDKAIVANRILCQTVGSVKEDSALSRKAVNTILKNTLQIFPDFLGTYTVWEANAFDNNDSAYVGQQGHDATGRFIPYWYRSANEIKLDPIVGYETEASGAWYFIPQKTGHETVMDPFYYEKVYMISVIHPILKDGQFYGITGVDMGMDFVQKLLDAFDIYDNKGSITILSDGGTIVASSKQPQLAGKQIESAFKNIPTSIFSQNLHSVLVENDTLRAFVPFKLGESKKTWVVMVQIPQKVLMASSNNLILTLILSGIGIIFLLVYGIYIFASRLTKPILSIAHLAEKISLGYIPEKQQMNNTSDEILKLHQSFVKIVDAQKDITEVCKAISENDFNTKAQVRSEEDQLSISVNKMIHNLQSVALEDKKRNWSTEGLAIFADLLRSESDISVLTNHIISKLINYLKANQGAIFIVNEEDSENINLKLIACYAYNRKKYLDKKIEIGDGLVGQCYLERSSIILTEIPENYITISSGLGQSRPRYVLITPLLREEHVMGVLEMASFQKIEDYQIAFVEKVAESIAATIYNTSINTKTRTLLDQAQMQTEVMRAQEEEMRQNMEELQATQEEMYRKEQDYLSEIARLSK